MTSLYREFVLHSSTHWKTLAAFVRANAKAACESGKPLRVIVTSSERKRNAEQNARLDAYLQQRFEGNFIMAGVKFWPEMSRLDKAFLELASHFQQVVPIFTNVIFDTSQPHANVIFEDMFAWLDDLLKVKS